MISDLQEHASSGLVLGWERAAQRAGPRDVLGMCRAAFNSCQQPFPGWRDPKLGLYKQALDAAEHLQVGP